MVQAAQDVIRELGYSDVTIESVERGSVWTWLKAQWVEGGRDLAVEKLEKVATQAEHYAELATVQKLQAEVDQLRSESVERLINCLSQNEADGAMVLGSLVVLKYTDQSGKARVIAKTLSPKEVVICEEHSGLAGSPATFLTDLATLMAQDQSPNTKAITQAG
ncbi:hypothetical protein D6T63_15895 [Arthrobacter cheniae]|uniref:Uncharacterized protein n=1 Tax=Arthrobacter cheniae TaxID=1258888 RepID=A0A3A5M7M2_9MICC|nr:hypothetical protein D6T63_15895 [Arthrobacter cheniae]